MDASLLLQNVPLNLPGMAFVWSDGDWVETKDFSLGPSDRGGNLGAALFETILAVNGLPKFVPAHESRLRNSCERLRWPFPEMDWTSICRELLERNGLTKGRGRLRLTLTAGSGPFNDISQGSDALVWLSCTAAAEVPQKLAASLSTWRRNEFSPLVGLKTASYFENLLALDHARAGGFDETIFLNTAGMVCEAATSNVFVVKEGKILTPTLESGCLPGVTRSAVLGLSLKLGHSPEETQLNSAILEAADEIFLTSAIRGPVPLSRLDHREFQSTPVADRVRAAWLEEICHD